MKHILSTFLILFSVNVCAESYSCAFKDGSQLILSREGNQFKSISSIDPNDPNIKESCKGNDNNTFCKTGKSEDILSIVFENGEFIKLERFKKGKYDSFLTTSEIVHINKKESEIARATLIGTFSSYSFNKIRCVLIP